MFELCLRVLRNPAKGHGAASEQPLEKRQLCDVAFQVADIMSSEFADGSFDVIYSRDSLLHIQDKPALFERLLRWLKPGGRMLFTDYCQSSQPLSPVSRTILAETGAALLR